MTEAAAAKPIFSGLLPIVALFFVFAVGLWVGGPRVVAGVDVHSECVFNAPFNKNFGHSINCDSSEFLYAVSDLNQLWGEEAKRQSRPGTMLLAWLLSRPMVAWLDSWADTQAAIPFKDILNDRKVMFTINRNELVGGYFGFIIQNLLILLVCYRLFLSLAGLPEGTVRRLATATALAGMIVLINNITKQFLWSPHTQMFTIMVPLLAVYFFVRMQETTRPERLFLIAGALCGVGMLFYGLFVLAALLAGLGYLWRRRGEWVPDLRRSARVIATGAGAMALFAVPYALWYGFIVWKNGAFYNYDVEYFRGFVWYETILAERGWGGVAYKVLAYFLGMFWGALLQGWGYLLALAGLAIYAGKGGLMQPENVRRGAYIWAAAALYAFLAAAFFAWYGHAVLRLGFTVLAAFLPLIGFYLCIIEKRTSRPGRLYALTMLAMCAYTGFMLVKYGPYS